MLQQTPQQSGIDTLQNTSGQKGSKYQCPDNVQTITDFVHLPTGPAVPSQQPSASFVLRGCWQCWPTAICQCRLQEEHQTANASPTTRISSAQLVTAALALSGTQNNPHLRGRLKEGWSETNWELSSCYFQPAQNKLITVKKTLQT